MKKNRLFFVMAALLLSAALFNSCQKEEVLNEELVLKSASELFKWNKPCPGEDLVLTLAGEGNRQIQQKINGEWVQIGQDNGGDEKIEAIVTAVELGTYEFRIKVGKGGYDPSVFITIEPCCEPGFTYKDNGDGTYTFTLTPEEDLDNSELVFTFAQSAYKSGLPETEGWMQAGNDGQVMKTTMNLIACQPLSWTVTLSANCSGNSEFSNVWTDFKVKGTSMKNNQDDKFVQKCS